MERYAVIKIRRPTQAEQDAFDRAMNYDRFTSGKLHGRLETGPQFHGDVTISVMSNAYGLELIVRALRMACVPYSIEDGQKVRTRKRKCGTSMQYALELVAITAEVVNDHTSGSSSTTPESVTPQEGDSGNTTGC